MIFLFGGVLVSGLMIMAGRAFSQSEAASLIGDTFLLATGGSKKPRSIPRETNW
jgi:hypothetical protein